MSVLIGNSEFVMLNLSITGFYFIVAGITFWCADYLVVVLGVDRAVASAFFSLTAFVAPISGVLVGGSATTYYGGYKTKKTRELVLIVGWICIAVTVPLPIVTNFAAFGVLMWCLLFFGGSLLPALTGIMLNSVPNNIRASANSFSYMSTNFLGWMPAPLIYGLVSHFANNTKSQLPMAVLLYSEFFTLGMMTYVIIKQLRGENM